MVTEEDLYIGDLPDGDLDIATDFLPFGDTSDSKNAKRITPTALKVKLALNNVNNTSDANKPISEATQTALDAKQATITGAATTIDTEDLTSSRALVSNGAGKVAVSDVTATELSYLDGVTSAIQTQLDGKVDENASITGATKTKITYDAKGLVTAGEDISASDLPTGIDSAKIADGTVSNAEFQYLNGVTSAIQTQIAAKLGFTAGATYTGSTTLVLTQAEYDAIGSKNANTIYFIV